MVVSDPKFLMCKTREPKKKLLNANLRRLSTDLDALQPLLKKYISYLATDVLPLCTPNLRPRVELDRVTVWLGIKALLGFLEPPAFEEGILDRYPIFLSVVLNHISDDSPEFSCAVNCLRLLFEMLGYKLWLKTSLSPSVMRNTLLGQCFHTRNEKSHKEIFDLFQPFLQACFTHSYSLEALQDGEHEKQRRNLLYFLLHQVTVSSNFSLIMRKKACQIALFIVHRGYTMNPPSPPYECAHMWWRSRYIVEGRPSCRLAKKLKIDLRVWNREVFGRVEVKTRKVLNELERWSGHGGYVDPRGSSDLVVINLAGLPVHLWCIDLFLKVGNLCVGFVNVIYNLPDMARARILVKKEGKIPISIKVDDGEVEYRVWLSMKFRPLKLKVDWREEFEVYGRRGSGIRGDKKGNKFVKEVTSKPWEGHQMW
ncbi:hypothetical protein CQW23_11347 [Capsicum baccatum]|uniref:DUF4283 domain-containing protein n=1 Tax=Capsicum baccatum TaxID=33114 RepID=A0A2G2WPN3_CAPBA|nr:hypothetical protein CQW23_11347 [Capsicum baccatum]